MTPNETENQERQYPICPHCKREPCQIGANLVGVGPLVCAVFICTGCRKILSVGTISIPDQAPPPAPESESLLYVPGRNS